MSRGEGEGECGAVSRGKEDCAAEGFWVSRGEGKTERFAEGEWCESCVLQRERCVFVYELGYK